MTTAWTRLFLLKASCTPAFGAGAALGAICAGRGWLLAGGRPDIARASALVLDEFRAGLIGKVSLQRPGDQAIDEAPVPVLQAELDERPDMKRRAPKPGTRNRRPPRGRG